LSRAYQLERVTSAPIRPNRQFETYEIAARNKDIEEIAAENQSTGRPPSEEVKARRRFLARFRKKGGEEPPHVMTGEMPPNTDDPPEPKQFTIGNQLRATIFNSPLNILLLAVPAGFVVNYLHLNPIAVFFVNFGAILPLTTLFSYAIDELRIRYKGIGGMLIYMSFGYVLLFPKHTSYLLRISCK
jgi:Ca2+:H+ antiporter